MIILNSLETFVNNASEFTNPELVKLIREHINGIGNDDMKLHPFAIVSIRRTLIRLLPPVGHPKYDELNQELTTLLNNCRNIINPKIASF